MGLLRRKKLVVAAALIVGITGGVAFAYWTTGGSGTGTAATGDVVDVVVNQTSTISGLAPGLPAQTLSGNFDNPNAGPVYISTVTVSIASVTDAVGDPIVGCDATDYTLADAVMTVNAEIPTGTGVGAWTGATIQFNNKATNQDPCKLAVVNLAYTAA